MPGGSIVLMILLQCATACFGFGSLSDNVSLKYNWQMVCKFVTQFKQGTRMWHTTERETTLWRNMLLQEQFCQITLPQGTTLLTCVIPDISSRDAEQGCSVLAAWVIAYWWPESERSLDTSDAKICTSVCSRVVSASDRLHTSAQLIACCQKIHHTAFLVNYNKIVHNSTRL